MKKISIVTFLLTSLIGFNALSAQGPSRGQHMSSEERMKMTMDNLNESIEMTDEQQQEITTIFTDFYAQMDALRNNSTGRPDRTKFEALRDERDKKVKEVLDKKQYKTYLKVMEEARNSYRGRQGGRPQQSQPDSE
jgi:hypothetical protein